MQFDDPSRRRWWLLTKGLETHPLKDALLLAHAAEAFVLGDHGEHALPAPVSASPQALFQVVGSGPDTGQDADDGGVANGDIAAPAVDPNVVVATVSELIVYLRRQDDVVVQQPNGLFLVNGRSTENPDQLLMRANRIRKRHRLPVFVLLPVDAPSTAGPGSLAAFSMALAGPVAALFGC